MSTGVVLCVNFNRCQWAGKLPPKPGTPTIACRFCGVKVPTAGKAEP